MKTVLAIGLVLVAGLLYLTIPRAESATGAQTSLQSAEVLERSSELTAAAAPRPRRPSCWPPIRTTTSRTPAGPDGFWRTAA